MTAPVETLRFPEPVAYAPMLARQKERWRAVVDGRADSALFLLQHRPVITLGRDAHEANLLLTREGYADEGIELVETDRGGDVTDHGPGQLVAYPVIDLGQWRRSVGGYLRNLEEALIRTLATWDLAGERVPGLTGVWVGGAKVAAIGIGVRRWVTCHGIALNVDPVLRHFQTIVPCGIADKPVTTLRQLLGEAPPMDTVMDRFDAAFRDVFDVPPP